MATRQGLEGHIAGMPRAYVGTIDLSRYAPPVEGASEGWMERMLATLNDAAPVWLGDPADRAAALLTAIAGGVLDLSDALRNAERVQLALAELTTSCDAAPFLLGDPADRAAALVTAMGRQIDGLDEDLLATERVQLALDDLSTSCQSALQLAMTGDGRR